MSPTRRNHALLAGAIAMLVGCSAVDREPPRGAFHYEVSVAGKAVVCDDGRELAGTLTVYPGAHDEQGRTLMFGVMAVCAWEYDVKGLFDGGLVSLRVNLPEGGLNIEALHTPGALDGEVSGHNLSQAVFSARAANFRRGKVLGPAGLNDLPPAPREP